MTVYLLHFHTPLVGKARKPGGKAQSCGHYLGATKDLGARIEAHRAGRWEELETPEPTESGGLRAGRHTGAGAAVVAAANSAGIAWRVARVWEGGFELECALKKRNNNRELCPLCIPRLGVHEYDGPVLCNQAWADLFAIPLVQAVLKLDLSIAF